MALTGKKRAFADAVLAGFSNKEAAIRAGYSEATASAAGSRLVKDKDVKARLDQARQAQGASTRTVAPPAGEPHVDTIEIPSTADPVEFLTNVMNEPAADLRLRIDAAKAMLPFKHKKLGEGGKKEQAGEKAKSVASRFSSSAPPALKAVK
ncbi:terminase small subunit [Massilia brevitalea]|uniref:terminase small subunit n=1 Tax=Massilia brevitalea TaxID=442526 RepID=UPI00273855AB|nr:terminase small subunit [Massilia brevitalea]